jgi:hypothetical protein
VEDLDIRRGNVSMSTPVLPRNVYSAVIEQLNCDINEIEE